MVTFTIPWDHPYTEYDGSWGNFYDEDIPEGDLPLDGEIFELAFEMMRGEHPNADEDVLRAIAQEVMNEMNIAIVQIRGI